MTRFWCMELPIEEDCQYIDFAKSTVRTVSGEDDGKSKEADGLDFDEVRRLFPSRGDSEE